MFAKIHISAKIVPKGSVFSKKYQVTIKSHDSIMFFIKNVKKVTCTNIIKEQRVFERRKIGKKYRYESGHNFIYQFIL